MFAKTTPPKNKPKTYIYKRWGGIQTGGASRKSWYFLSCDLRGASTLTGWVIGNTSATTCRRAEVLCVFDTGQMNSGGQEQRG